MRYHSGHEEEEDKWEEEEQQEQEEQEEQKDKWESETESGPQKLNCLKCLCITDDQRQKMDRSNKHVVHIHSHVGR